MAATALLLSDAKYYSPSGKDLQDNGVAPDTIVSKNNNRLDLNSAQTPGSSATLRRDPRTEAELQLEKAIQVLKDAGPPQRGPLKSVLSVLVQLNEVSKAFGSRIVLRDVSFQINPVRKDRPHRNQRFGQDHSSRKCFPLGWNPMKDPSAVKTGLQSRNARSDSEL